MHPQAKKRKHCLQPPEARRKAGTIHPQSPRKEQANTLILDPRLQFVVICDLRSRRNLIYDHFLLMDLEVACIAGSSHSGSIMHHRQDGWDWGHLKGFLEHMSDTWARETQTAGDGWVGGLEAPLSGYVVSAHGSLCRDGLLTGQLSAPRASSQENLGDATWPQKSENIASITLSSRRSRRLRVRGPRPHFFMRGGSKDS